MDTTELTRNLRVHRARGAVVKNTHNPSSVGFEVVEESSVREPTDAIVKMVRKKN